MLQYMIDEVLKTLHPKAVGTSLFFSRHERTTICYIYNLLYHKKHNMCTSIMQFVYTHSDIFD